MDQGWTTKRTTRGPPQRGGLRWTRRRSGNWPLKTSARGPLRSGSAAQKLLSRGSSRTRATRSRRTSGRSHSCRVLGARPALHADPRMNFLGPPPSQASPNPAALLPGSAVLFGDGRSCFRQKGPRRRPQARCPPPKAPLAVRLRRPPAARECRRACVRSWVLAWQPPSLLSCLQARARSRRK